MHGFFDKRWSAIPGPMPRIGWTILAVAAVGLVGCGKSEGPTGAVSGQVLLGTEPLREGGVQFFRTDGVPVGAATLDSSGNFKFDKPLPAGQYRVAILPAAAKEVPAGAEGAPTPAAAAKVPAKYLDISQSDLKAEVKAGDNPPLRFELK